MFLKRLDDLGVAIEKLIVDPNEGVILGRGPLMKITDTKISRNHAKIVIDSDKNCLVFINIGKKPCYTKENKEEEEFSFVEKDESVEIGNGSVIGLLPDQYIYEINDWEVCDKEKKSTPKVEIVNESENEPRPGSSGQNNVIDWDKHRNTLNSDMVEMLKHKEENEKTGRENKEENHKRPSCLYGKVGCTRKNPEHFKAEAHPGDDDYVEIAQSSDNEGEENDNDSGDKPECEYGLDCYRKNPQHRKDYKHSSRPRGAKRKTKEKAAKKKAKTDGDNEDYDSSFIDDDFDEDDLDDITDDEESVDEWTPGDDE